MNKHTVCDNNPINGVYMLISILAILVILLLATVATLISTRAARMVPDNDFSVELLVPDFKREIKRLARAVKITKKGGNGYDPAAMRSTFVNVKNMLKRKIDEKRDFSHAERWIYENYYLLMRSLNGIKFTGLNLPHYNSIPRIIILARKIVRLSGANFDRDRLTLALQTFVSETPLMLGEIFYLETAIKIAFLEDIYVIAKKLLYAEKMYRLATYKAFKPSLLDSDVYKKFVIDNKDSSGYAREFLFKNGVNLENVEFNYTSLVVERDRRAERAFATLHNLSEIVNTEEIVCLATVSTLLTRDEVYKNTDYEGKICVLKEIEKISDDLNVSEYMTASLLVECALNNGFNVFDVLFDMKKAFKKCLKSKDNDFKPNKDSSVLKQKSFISPIILLSAATVAAFYFLPLALNLKITVMALTVIPVFLFFSAMCEKILLWFASPRPIPALKTADNRALVVVSEYISNEKQAEDAITHLEALAEVNKQENIVFSLLVDFSGADSEEKEDDQKILDIFESRLKGKQNYNVFVRKRIKNIDGKYQGYERKRGAIEQLNSYLLKESDSMRFVLDKEMPLPEFVLLLDADNTLTPYAVNEMVKSAAHPFNAQYDLMVAPAKCSIISAKTAYSKRFISFSGVSQYPEYGNLFFNVFSRAVFCGKGIYRLSRFKTKLEGKIKENSVLSHDILEGSILTTGMLSTPIFEEAPKNFVSEFERRNRWRRGDLMLFPYLKEKTEPIYRFIMLKNIMTVFKPLMIFALFAVFAFTLSYPVLFVGAGALFATYLLDIISALKTLFVKRRARYVLKEVFLTMFYSIEDFFTIPLFAVNSLIISLNLAVKRIKRGNMLEWKTYYQSQSCTKNGKQYKLSIPSAVIATALAVLVFIFGTSFLINVLFLVYLILCCLFAVSYSTKQEKRKKPLLTHSDRQILKGFAASIYRYFEYNRGELVGDNLQIKNYKGLCKRTSPTNIGYSLLSEISAHYIGIIDTDQTIKNIKEIIDLILPLKKWKGNLYNWYDTVKKEPLYPRFVSSVDSGNFVAGLIVTAEFLNTVNETDLKNTIQKMISETDLSALFDKGRNLFYIGFNEEENAFKSHYDLLASEARLLSYVATGLGYTDYKHWSSLSRECCPISGNTLFSWSGTAFEYLMPEQFIGSPKDTLMGKSVYNSVKTMIKRKCKGVWGVSESAYYCFDNEGTYQYKAFGLSELALRSERNECVISPYSSIMALGLFPKAVFLNLSRLTAFKMQGEFGFYDALDMRNEKRVVSTFMAHHQGMSLVGFANYLCGDAIVKLFYKNINMSGTESLLNESLCQNVMRTKSAEKFAYIEKNDNEYFNLVDNIEQFPKINLLKSQNYKIMTDDAGNGFSLAYGKSISRYNADYLASQGMFFYILENEKLHSATFSPVKCDDKFTTVFTDNETAYLNDTIGSKMCVVAPACIPGEVRRLEIKNESEIRRNIKICFYTDISLMPFKDFDSHPVFNNLFVETKLDEERKAVIIKRRARELNGDFYCAFLYDDNTVFDIETNRFNFIGRNHDLSNPVFFESKPKTAPSFGDVLEPCVAISTDIELSAGESFAANIVILTANSEEQLFSNIDKVRTLNIYEYGLNSSENIRTDSLSRKLAGKILYRPYSLRQLKKIEDNKSKFLNNTDYGENKLIIYDFKSIEELSLLPGLNKIADELSEFIIPFNIIVLYDEEDGYHERIKHELEERLKNPKIKLIERNEESEKLKEIAFLNFDKDFELPIERFLAVKSDIQKGKAEFDLSENIKYETGEGGFTDDGYAVIPYSEATMLPYSNVIGEKYGGFITTEKGGGFVYFTNSRENKVTKFDNDPIMDTKGERLYFIYCGKYYDLTENASCVHKKGETVFKGFIDKKPFELKEYMIRDGKIKIYEFEFINAGSTGASLLYEAVPVLGASINRNLIYTYEENSILTAKNVKNGQSVSLKGLGGRVKYIQDKSKLYLRNANGLNFELSSNCYINNPALALTVEPENGKGNFKAFIVLSCYKNEIEDIAVSEIAKEYINNRKKIEESENIRLKSKNTALNVLFNDCLLYQVKSSRINAKAGFYQVGGAFGFRDQLQDIMAFIDSDPDAVRLMIIKMAEHQYTDGDVMHWWHEPYEMGLRSKVSDDKLFLPLTLGAYVERTGDYNILTDKVFYLYSSALGCQKCRYEYANTAYSETVLEHAKRAIESALIRGEHGLLLIGSGDWNDAMDEVGIMGKGESVPLTMLCVGAIESILPYVESDIKELYLMEVRRLKTAIIKHGYISYFKRGYKDDGESFGDPSSDCIKIDLLSQSFAAMFNIADETMLKSALQFASSLEDSDNRIIKLLTPPLDKSHYLGYISAYPKGIRENGGQYTHAAVWYLFALLNIGQINKAYELLGWLNPIERGRNKNLFMRYKAEPYVLSGDVYSNADNIGRAGWSWYTGSAGWLYRLIKEEILGLKKYGKELSIRPKLPDEMNGAEVNFKYGNALIKIKYILSDAYRLIYEKIELKNTDRIPLIDGKNAEVTVFVEKANG